jgi:acyl-CoA synthetase (AMP-forming)/AMP-acid ligase II
MHFFGVLFAGAIPVPVYPPTRPSRLEEHVHRHAEILINAGADVLITFQEARRVARLLRTRVSGLRHVLPIGELANLTSFEIGATDGRRSGSANLQGELSEMVLIERPMRHRRTI